LASTEVDIVATTEIANHVHRHLVEFRCGPIEHGAQRSAIAGVPVRGEELFDGTLGHASSLCVSDQSCGTILDDLQALAADSCARAILSRGGMATFVVFEGVCLHDGRLETTPNPPRSAMSVLIPIPSLPALFFLCFSIGALTEGAPAQERSKPGTAALSEAEFAKLHELKAGKAPKLLGVNIEVAGAKAYLSLPLKGKPTAAVLVIHEWWGLNDHIKHWSDRLAADGYAALAIDLYGGVVATTREGASTAMRSVDAVAAAKVLEAAHAFLASDPRVKARKRACIGWCFGGGWSLRHAIASPDLDAAVVYYGHLTTDAERLAAIRAPILGVFGDKDRGIPPASVDAFAKAMKKAGKSLELRRYDANHAFANPSSARYDKVNAGKAWREVRAFLKQHLGEAVVTGEVLLVGKNVVYSVPKTWKMGGERPMRIISFTEGESECYVTQLGGAAGGVSANLNRWRQQMGQDQLTEKQIAALPRLPMLGAKAVVVRIDGDYSGFRGKGTKDATMLGVICSLRDATVFVKMIGPKKEMNAQVEPFKKFCRSLK
jgi:carboxymethylenebutenolidase